MAATLLIAGPAAAHFQLSINIRVVHIEHLADGVRVLMRLPTPYVLASRLGPEQADGQRAPAPYSWNDMRDGELMHFVDVAALHADPLGLGRLVAAGHRMIIADAEVTAEVEATRVYPGTEQPPFANLEEARAAFSKPLYEHSGEPLFVGDTVTDVILVYRTGGAVYSYEFASTLNPGLEGQEKTANLVIDYFPGGSRVFRATGLLDEPIIITGSALAAAWTFVREGVTHILEGADHVLFVVCLALGATRVRTLLWRVTGFTIGHSVTLAAGFFGFAPAAAWFVPAIETGIALSIVYAAVIALMQREVGATFLVTTAIGLLHGLGFAFVLEEILQVDSPNLWQSLLAFNAGVELGQVAIILLTWPLFYLAMRYKPALWSGMRWAVALPCIAIAALWMGQRLVLLAEAL